jgi:hypothetical protein
MTYTRRLWALLALVLTFVLTTCNTPADLSAPTLEPQFGTADDDRGVDVATVSTGRIYSLSQQSGYLYEDDGSGSVYESGTYDKAVLRRYDGSGNLTLSKEINGITCDWYYDYDCSSFKTKSLHLDSKGYVYVLQTHKFYNEEYHYNFVSHAVTKYDALGNYIDSFSVGGDGEEGSSDVSMDSMSAAVDGNGNIYAAGKQHTFDHNAESGYTTNIVAKYNTNGALLWQRTSTVGTPYGITASSTGSVYVVGTTGIARYTSSGGLTWRKAANNSKGILANAGNIAISGSYIYTRSGKDIRKYDGNGKQLWLKTQSGLNTIVVQDMAGDGSGNLYVSGKYQVSSGNMSAYVRKLNASGSILWTKTYGTPAYDDALGVATITGSEIYTTGETQGSLAHTNIGGRDGYLRKQNSTGGLVWNR